MRGVVLFAAVSLAGGLGAVNRPIAELYREHWTTRDGLPHNSINAITQTPEGYLWFATWEGLVRYNGQRFSVFDRGRIPALEDAALRAAHIDAQGRLVVGGARGSLVRQSADGTWKALPLAPGMVTGIDGDAHGRLWIGTETSGVLRIDEADHGTVLAPTLEEAIGSNFDLEQDVRGRWWAGHAAGLRRIDASGLTDDDVEGLPPGPVMALAREGDRLIAGGPEGVFVADARADRLAFRPLAPDLLGIHATRLLPDSRGGLWIGTLKDGLMRWGPGGLDRLGVGPDRPSSRVLALFVDREDSLWVGTNSGLFRFTRAPFSNLLRQHGLPDDYVRSVLARDDGSVLVGTAQGLAVSHADGRVDVLGTGTALEGASVLSLAEDPQGRVWVGTYDEGALLWDGERVATVLDLDAGLPSNEVRALVVDGDVLWAGTTRGLVRWDGTSMRRWTKVDGLPTNFVIALHQDRRGRLWIGTGFGAMRMEGDRLRAIDLGAYEAAEYAFGFLEDVDRDQVWVASDRGLLRFDADGRPTGAVGLAAGLPYEKVFGLLRDPDDQLWATGNRGVLRLDMTRLNAVADGQPLPLGAERFTESDGMASAQGNGGSQPVLTMDREGRRWFATAVGASRVDPTVLGRHARNPPPVIIESVGADGEALPGVEGGRVRVPPGARRVELRFAGLSFVLPERLRYRYRLKGFDGEWIERDGETLAEYTALPPGQYTFEVEAAHPRGAWSQAQARVVIDVAPLWWQRPAVIWSGALVLVGGLALLLRWRLRQIAANERHLARLVEQRTLEIEQQKARLHQQAEEFARQAREDALTGISNRRAFDEALAREFARARRSDAPLCIAIVDLDHFKRVNDRWSHAVGDEVLKRVATHLTSASRGFDLVARWGGEEFAILMPETPLAAASATCERLREGLAAIDFADIDPDLRITASFGLAESAAVDDHDRLLMRADAALYRAKANGRNRVEA